MQTIMAARSNYSIGESILTVDQLLSEAQRIGAKAVALTDTMSVTGLIEFSKKARAADIKPIIGCRLRLVDDPTWRKPKGEKQKTPPHFFVTAYVLSDKGKNALFRLLTLANSETHFYQTAKLGFGDLAAQLSGLTPADIRIATGDLQSLLHHPDHARIIDELVAAIGRDGVYLSLTPIDTPLFDTLNKHAIELARSKGLKTLTARPTCYFDGEAAAAEIMNAVASNTTLDSLWHNQPAYTDLHAHSGAALIAQCASAVLRLQTRFGISGAGAEFKQGLLNTEALADAVSYAWAKAEISLPVMAPDEFATLVSECKKGWSKRFFDTVFGHKPSTDDLANIYRPRLAYELSVLKKLGFAGYFLLVQDVVRFAKENGILVGPGRGSVGGSLVAYLVGITDCDPIRFDLLFERFINPDRIDLPDADLDFMSERRHEVIQYLVNKYGPARVAGISNIINLAPASSIRYVSKAFGLNERDYACSKLMPKKHGAHVPLEEAAEEVAEIGVFRDTFGPIWNTALRLNGLTTTLGRHAAGVVVSGCDLVERAVIERRNGEATVNWDKRVVEEQGLVKIDILGLETLDLIKATCDYIVKRHGVPPDLNRIPLDLPKVLEGFATGMTIGVFQFESAGMRRLLRELGKGGQITFDDITAATALYRPGPIESGMMDSYWKRKQGDEDVVYDHPKLEPILAPTFGVIVYQEQVMKTAQVIAGYSAAEADKLRKIMGKKLPEEMKKERTVFVEGCMRTVGCKEEWAGELFDKIEGFAGYGFNKSHSVEYTLISYQAMYLKTFYPVEFIAAALSLMKAEKLSGILKDAARLGISLEMPDVNLSSGSFEIVADDRLIMPFGRVKGLTTRTADAVVAARNDGKGPFVSIVDFSSRVDRRLVNKSRVEALNKIGAFAAVEPGQLPANDPSRLADQRDLIPELCVAAVPVNREMHRDRVTKAHLSDIINEYRSAHTEDGAPVKPAIGRDANIAVVFDCPSTDEEAKGQMTLGNGFAWKASVEAMHSAGLSTKDFYWTALIKRPKEGKQVSADEIRTYSPYLRRELDALKPPVIVLLGTATIRHFIKDFKGKASEAAGQVIYSKELDANFVIGFSPGEIYFDGEKQALLNEVFETAGSLSVT